MSELPKPVMVNQKHWQALMASQRNMEASQRALDMFADRIRGQIAAGQDDARAAWQAIAQENPQLDLRSINWEPSDVPGQLIPVAMRFTK